MLGVGFALAIGTQQRRKQHMELFALFGVSLLAATILPAQSEILLAALHIQQTYPATALLLAATTGNVLGSCINWLLGRYCLHFQDRRWFPIKKKALQRASTFYQKYGIWTLLLAWTPFIGDPLTVVAGLLRTPFWLFFLLVTIGKAGRYISLLVLI
jgi:membrane protein YqaA with SNARE-associated domain